MNTTKDGIKATVGEFMVNMNINDMNDYLDYIKRNKLKPGDHVRMVLIKEN